MPKSKPPRKRSYGKNAARSPQQDWFRVKASRLAGRPDPEGFDPTYGRVIKGGAVGYLFWLYLPLLIIRGVGRAARGIWRWLQGY